MSEGYHSDNDPLRIGKGWLLGLLGASLVIGAVSVPILLGHHLYWQAELSKHVACVEAGYHQQWDGSGRAIWVRGAK